MKYSIEPGVRKMKGIKSWMSPHKKYDLTAMRDFQTSKRSDKELRRLELFETAQSDCRRIVAMIIDKYQPMRLYQWGSLLDKKKFRDYSDIDIAVEGITEPQKVFAMLDEADRMTEFPVDIVTLESIHPLHADSIRNKGKLIYGKK
jgi:predicted nucleotidyltransferase